MADGVGVGRDGPSGLDVSDGAFSGLMEWALWSSPPAVTPFRTALFKNRYGTHDQIIHGLRPFMLTVMACFKQLIAAAQPAVANRSFSHDNKANQENSSSYLLHQNLLAIPSDSLSKSSRI